MVLREIHRLRQSFGGRAGAVLLIISLVWAVTIGARIVYPAVIPGIQAEFGFRYTTVGLLVGAVWGAYGLMQFPGGLLADLWSDRFAIVVGLGVTIVGLGLLVGGNLFTLFVIGTIIMGAGTGLLGPSRVAVLVNAYPNTKSTAVAISQAAGTLGNTLLPVIAGILMGILGWRFGIGYLLPLIVIIMLAAWAVVPLRQSGLGKQRFRYTIKKSARELHSRAPLLGMLAMLGVMIAFQSLTGFLPTFFTDEANLSATRGSVLFGMFFASGLLMQVSAGLVADRFDPGRTIGLFAAIAIPGLVLILLAESIVFLGLGVFLASGVLGCFPPGLTYLVSSFSVSIQGSGFGVVRTGYIGGGALGPVVVGFIADWLSLWFAFFTIVVVLVVLVVVATLLPNTEESNGKIDTGGRINRNPSE